MHCTGRSATAGSEAQHAKALTVGNLLRDWNIQATGIDVCDESTLELALVSKGFGEAAEWCQISGEFDRSCKIYTSGHVVRDLRRIQIARIPGEGALSDVSLVILKAQPELRINIAASGTRIFVGRFGHTFAATLNTWRDAVVCIGDRATSNGARIIVDKSSVIIGRDSMLSDEVLIQSNDQHGIVDLETMNLINDKRRFVHVGEHVWIGRRATIMPDVKLCRGCVIGAGAIVATDVESCAVCAGAPARILRRNASWCRAPEKIDVDELVFLAQRSKT